MYQIDTSKGYSLGKILQIWPIVTQLLEIPCQSNGFKVVR
jgi:hypothetical protein